VNSRPATPRSSLEKLFRPAAVAVVGASPTNEWGRAALENLPRLNYPGKVAAVNPKYEEVLGFPCAPTLGLLPFLPDAVLVCVNSDRAVSVVEEAAELGVKAAVVWAIGFAEVGESERQDRLADAARAGGMALIGPNCIGLMSFTYPTPLYMDTVHPYQAGRVALISQSGSVLIALTNNKRGVRWSHIVSVGNEAVTDSADLLSYFVDDPATSVICMFLETIRDAERFFAECDRARQAGKPVVILKSGRTPAGAAVATAHSGALALPDRLIDALMRRHRVLRVETLDELLETAIAVQSPRRPRGRNLATVAGSGGIIELILDQAEPLGLAHPAFGPECSGRLRELLPGFLDVKNPLDWWGMDDVEVRYPQLLDAIAHDQGTDIVLSIGDHSFYPTGHGDDRYQFSEAQEAVAREGKVVVMLDPVDGCVPPEEAENMLEKGIISLSGVAVGMRAVRNLVSFSEPIPPEDEPAQIDTSRLASLLTDGAQPTGGLPALEILASAGFPVAETRIAANECEAVEAANQIGYPIVLKSADPNLLHKTEAGAVILNLRTDGDVQQAARRILSGPADSILLQRHTAGAELILGLETHPQLGTFLLVGLGGIWTEILDDVSIRPIGLRKGEAEDMLRSLRGSPLLYGARGNPPVDIASLVSAINTLDAVGRELGKQLQSVDINPIIATPNGVTVVDAVIVPAATSSGTLIQTCHPLAQGLLRRVTSGRRRLAVTSQVTTPPGNGRRSATQPDVDMLLTCSNPTQSDAIVRNRHVW
jgi:acetate---CoA ligase (ADP-forming)